MFLGASFLAHTHAQHDGERGHLPERQRRLLPGETTRKRLSIPMFLGRSTRGGRREGQRHARRTGCGADMRPALEGKHAGHGERVWCPSMDWNRADFALGALTAVRSTARKRHDDDYSSPHAES